MTGNSLITRDPAILKKLHAFAQKGMYDLISSIIYDLISDIKKKSLYTQSPLNIKKEKKKIFVFNLYMD